MNWQNLSFQHVEPPPSSRQTGSQHRASASNRPGSSTAPGGHGAIEDKGNASLEHASLSPQPSSVVRFTPSLPSYSTSRSSSNIDGLERHYGRPPLHSAMAVPTGQGERSSQQPRLTQQQLETMAVAHDRRTNPLHSTAARPAEEFRDPLALEAARVTPGVDDTPYIQYAIEALTRERDGEETNPSSTGSGEQQHLVSGNERRDHHSTSTTGPMTSQPLPKIRGSTRTSHNDEQSAPLLAAESGRKVSSPRSSMSTLVKGREKGAKCPPRQPAPDAWEPVEPELLRDGREKINPRLVFKPKILRKTSMITLMVLCLTMTASLIFSAVYSQGHDGLWDYVGTIYSGQYFLFRVFPAMVGAVILFHAQCITTTTLRVLPFARLAKAEKAKRRDAIFDELYPTSFLRPQVAGDWTVWVPMVVTWVMNFTLPLLSCLYTVVYVDGRWRWATVQGVVWTLVALYVLLSAAVGIELSSQLMADKTGLMWDVRSIADVIALVANSNTLEDYSHTEILGPRDQLKQILHKRRTDRLAYWGWADRERPDEIWYGLGHQEEWESPTTEIEVFDEKGKAHTHAIRTVSKHSEEADPWGDVELEGTAMHPRVRYRHLPFCLKDLPLMIFIVLGFLVLVALFVVSFIPQTRLTAKGFLPLLSAAPIQGAFSAADFLYSFLPAILGLFLFVAFQDLDLHLRILQPWGELSSPPAGGALPESSILADYAACLPLQSTIRAVQNRHWRVAFISLLSTLFVFIPILAGGMFMALTPQDSIVRVYPQNALFALVLALLVLYWLALVTLFPGRQALRLPHGVTCIAEIISFVANDDCVGDEAFQGMIRNKTTLVGKLGVNRRDEDKPRWTFHTGGAGARDERLGVRRVRRFGEGQGEGRGLMRHISGGAILPLKTSLGTATIGGARREARRSERESVRVSPQFVFQPREGVGAGVEGPSARYSTD